MNESKNNKGAYFWYYEKKLNTIPFDTINKKPVLPEHKQFRNERIPVLEFNDWMKRGLFEKGMAIFPGKIYSENQEGLFWVSIDLDSQTAINEFCLIFGKDMNLKRLSESFLVEQHSGNLKRAHISLISPIPFPKKGADKKLGIEVKSRGEHGIMIVSPSPHADGSNYEIIGTKNPLTLSQSEAKKVIEGISNICKKFGLNYSEKIKNSRLDDNDIRWMIRNLKIKSDTNFKIEERERNDTLFSIARSIVSYHGYDNSKETWKI